MKARTKRAARTKPKSQTQLVRFVLEDVSAAAVGVAGTFNDWQPTSLPMSAGESGRWNAELALPPGRYEYLFVVDGQWRVDPVCQEQVANPFGGMNCVLEVRALE